MPTKSFHFSLQRGEAGALISPGLLMKKLRLRVIVTCQGHSLVSDSFLGFEPRSVGLCTSPLTIGATLCLLRPKPHMGQVLLLPGPRPLTSLCPIVIRDVILCVTLSKQAPHSIQTQKSMRCSCFPPEASTLKQFLFQ